MKLFIYSSENYLSQIYSNCAGLNRKWKNHIMEKVKL